MTNVVANKNIAITDNYVGNKPTDFRSLISTNFGLYFLTELNGSLYNLSAERPWRQVPEYSTKYRPTASTSNR